MNALLCRVRYLWINLWFILQIIPFIPLFFMAGYLSYPKGHVVALWMNRYFSWILGIITGMYPRVRYQNPKKKPNPRHPHVIVANHTSVLDIPALALTPFATVFVGKDAVANFVPFFFEYFYQFHIRLNRQSLRSGHQVVTQAAKALRTGFYVAFFPEGGIRSKRPPILAPFQNGAFRLAIEEKKPVLPIAMPFNWVIAPKYRSVKPFICPLMAHVLAPIETAHMTLADVPKLRQQAFAAIEGCLRSYHPHAFSHVTRTA